MTGVYPLITFAFGFSIMVSTIIAGVSILNYKSFMNTLTDRFTAATAVIVVAVSAFGIYLVYTSLVRIDALGSELNAVSVMLIPVAVYTATGMPALILNAKLRKKMNRHDADAAS